MRPRTGLQPVGARRRLRAMLAEHVTEVGAADHARADRGHHRGPTGASARPPPAGCARATPWSSRTRPIPGAIAAFAQAGARLVGVASTDAGGPASTTWRPPWRRARPGLPAAPRAEPDRHRCSTGARAAGAGRARPRLRVPSSRTWPSPTSPGRSRPAPASLPSAPTRRSPSSGSLSKLFWGGLRLGLRAGRRAAGPALRPGQGHAATSARRPSASCWPSGCSPRPGRSGEPGTGELRRRYEVLAGALAGPVAGLGLRASPPAACRSGSAWAVPTPSASPRRRCVTGWRSPPPRPLSVSDGHGDRIRLSFAAPPGRRVAAVAVRPWGGDRLWTGLSQGRPTDGPWGGTGSGRAGRKRRGSRAGPQMPKVDGFHSTGPSTAEIGHAAGQQRQRLLQLGPGQRRAHAEVDAGSERHLDGVALARVMSKRPGAAKTAGSMLAPASDDRDERARPGTGRRGTRCPPTPPGPCPAPHPGSASSPRPPGGPAPGCSASSAHWSGCSANSATQQASWLRVVSVPAMRTASASMTSSSLDSRSPASSMAMRALSRSSAGWLPALLDHGLDVGLELVPRRARWRAGRRPGSG